MRLRFCTACGHSFNSAFDEAVMAYGGDYDNALHHSPVFRDYASNLTDRLIATHHLQGARIVEIGCGDGDFLRLLCERSQSRGIGFDPSHGTDSAHGDVRILAKPFDRATSTDVFPGDTELRADLVVCRHVLEHMPAPGALVNGIRRLLARESNGGTYLEVPNFLHTLHGGIWDLIYEHCGYFSPASLTRLLETHGFRITNLRESYGGQFISVEAQLGEPNERQGIPAPKALAEMKSLVETFAAKFHTMRDEWQKRLDDLHEQKGRAVIWGAGSKGVMFLNLLAANGAVHCAIDLNPRKQGMFVPGTGQAIISPETLRDISPDLVIVMNSLYETEIQVALNAMSLKPEVMTV